MKIKIFPPWNWVPVLGIKNWNDGAIGPRKKFDDIFNRVDTIHQRDRQTDGHRPARETFVHCGGDVQICIHISMQNKLQYLSVLTSVPNL